MSIELPKPIAAYFAADRLGSEATARCFTEDATVIDEKRSHVGREAIARWKAQATTQYSYVCEPFAIEHDGEHIVVTSRVTGNFPGSPVDLRYSFVLEGDLIARLEIVP